MEFVGDVFDTVVVAIQAHAKHAQNEDVPEFHAGASGVGRGLTIAFRSVGLEVGLQQFKNFGPKLDVFEDELKPDKERWEFIATVGRDDDVLDSGLSEGGFWFESSAHVRGYHANVPVKRASFIDFSRLAARLPQNIRGWVSMADQPIRPIGGVFSQTLISRRSIKYF